MSSHALRYIPELMDHEREVALLGSLERLLSVPDLESIWPAANDERRAGRVLQINEVEVVVLHLDRIGAPAGASGSGVFIAYYVHSPSTGPVLRVSPPLVVKIGEPGKLREEKDGADSWPSLGARREKFALPLYLDTEDAKWAVLVAPFQSSVAVAEEGNRNEVLVRDLWSLLEDKNELLTPATVDWTTVGRCVGQALDAVHHAHVGGSARPVRKSLPYADGYVWYLRATTTGERLSHIPQLIFGSEDRLAAFGMDWPNPTPLVETLVASGWFEGTVGAVHGDLHPKNIVLDNDGLARIIDFGWAQPESHVVLDYLLLDLNVRGTTLPSQLGERDILALAEFLRPSQDSLALPGTVQARGKVIQKEIWARARTRAVQDWDREYLIPMLLVGYGLLVHLDKARNQPALVATVLTLARELERVIAGTST